MMQLLHHFLRIVARHQEAQVVAGCAVTDHADIERTMDTTGSTSAGDTLLTQALLTELSSLCRVEVEENLALVALIGKIRSTEILCRARIPNTSARKPRECSICRLCRVSSV
jgi:aspartokinase